MGPALVPSRFTLRRRDHGHRHARQPFGRARCRSRRRQWRACRPLRPALGRRDEAGAELGAGVAESSIARTKSVSLPTPPAQTTGRPRSVPAPRPGPPAERPPAWPPARSFTATARRRRRPCPSAPTASVHVVIDDARPPAGPGRRPTAGCRERSRRTARPPRGPHRSIAPCARGTALDDCSMSAFMPMGFDVSRRTRRSPARNSWPWTYVSEIGWTMPRPPASDTAATSSGLLQGYIAPHRIGTSIRAWAGELGARRALGHGPQGEERGNRERRERRRRTKG